SIAASLSGVSNIAATVNPDGTLKIDAAEGYSFAFSEDSSGALAVLGVNTFFTGKDANDIAVRAALHDQPGLLAAGLTVAGEPDDGAAVRGILALRDQANQALGGQSINDSWISAAADVGANAASAANRADATRLVRESLDAQRQSLSGVSIDEESINLLNFQRQYQGAARFISVVDEMTQTLLSIVG
ncbi:MAG: flagellar basal body rod C-terminal domain-containing protein, partial [Planctomycetaceae bacterium]|nr:flagellar basal body rod C-terminal domain-containing protein [Planctomycetaceae bacterium]